MVYPKPVMRIKELTEMGLPEEMLLRFYRMRGQRMAWKITPAKRNSPIVFDTEALDQQIKKEIEAQNRAIPRGVISCLREVMRK